MRNRTSFSFILATVATAVLSTSGCTYVKGLYAGKTAPSQSVATSMPTVPAYTPVRHYAADISAARAYVGTQLPASQRMALIDVRDASEFRLGHPEAARHVPYPRVYQACQAHPSGAPQAPLRSDDGSVCRYGVVPGSEVRTSAAAFWEAVQSVLPYKDAPVAVLCRTGACAVEAANVMARPDLWVDKQWKGQGYTQVHVVHEGFVGEPLLAVHEASGRVLSLEKKGEKLAVPGSQPTLYGTRPLALDINRDGKITSADAGGWRNFLGLPYVVSMPANLRSDLAQPYYDLP